MFLRRFSVCFLLVLSALSFADESITYKGAKIVDVLRKYQQQGMKINFSSGLVTSDMTVFEEPKSNSTRKILNEILNPHGLQIQDGPAKIYLVVRKRDANEQPELGPAISEEVNVPFVTIYIGAKDSDDRFITTLMLKDLVLKEDDAEQKIMEFTNLSDGPDEPISVMLLIDHSMSMNDHRAGVRKFDTLRNAVLKFMDQLHPQDRVMIGAFNQTFWPLSDLTQDKQRILDQLNQEPVLRERTALLDILPEAIQEMENFPGRKILVICSDGQDSASSSDLETVIHILQSSDVTVYAIGSDAPDGSRARSILKKLTNATGGYPFFTTPNSDPGKSILQVRKAIEGQYAVGYVPRYPFLHKWRTIRVECKIPGIRLHYRNRYLF